MRSFVMFLRQGVYKSRNTWGGYVHIILRIRWTVFQWKLLLNLRYFCMDSIYRFICDFLPICVAEVHDECLQGFTSMERFTSSSVNSFSSRRCFYGLLFTKEQHPYLCMGLQKIVWHRWRAKKWGDFMSRLSTKDYHL